MKKKFHTLTALAVGTGICLLSAPLVFAAENQPMTNTAAQQTTPGATTSAPDEIFGTRGGFIHPFMSVSAVNSDNI
ncbi:MAG: hypothetical protein KKG34_04620, partial [Proteobacteria bacterium]|nr:hypothetical protein [Pseudomonadota bacterium]